MQRVKKGGGHKCAHRAKHALIGGAAVLSEAAEALALALAADHDVLAIEAVGAADASPIRARRHG